MNVLKLFSSIAVAGLLTACASNYDVAGVASMPDKGDAFTKALHQRYSERAKFELGEYDWESVSFFVERARMAAEGKAPEPQKLEDRSLRAGVPEIKAARDRLVAALATNAPKDNPDACALAQTWFEHWMEQQEEGHQPNDIAMAKDGFMKAIPSCVVKVAAAPAPVPPPPPAPVKVVKTFIVYFDNNKSDLNSAAQAVVNEAAKAAREMSPANVYVVGHTDTTGSAAYNAKLSAKRADTVSQALNKTGVPARTLDVKSQGKTMLAVPTPDNKSEARNRRVEIRFEK